MTDIYFDTFLQLLRHLQDVFTSFERVEIPASSMYRIPFSLFRFYEAQEKSEHTV